MKKLISILLALALCLGLGAYVLEGTASADGTAGFTDVPDGAYYAAPVKWAVEKGITTGTTKSTFSPDEKCTTAQIITFLWRAMGKPVSNISNPFGDVKEGAYYYSAALWAYEKGMVSGTVFGPDVPCTRSQTVTYLWKCAGKPRAKQASFSDVSASAGYAAAVSWAVEKGITTGTSDTTFSPDNTCTRGQIVTFLHRDIGGASAPAPDNSGTKRMARAMLDKISELGSRKAYLLDMNADGTPELVCYNLENDDSFSSDDGYRVFRWDGQKLYQHEFNDGYAAGCGWAIVEYHNEYAIYFSFAVGTGNGHEVHFLDRMVRFMDLYDSPLDDAEYFCYFNDEEVTEAQYRQLLKEYGLDKLDWDCIFTVRTDLPDAITELNKLLAG